MTGTFAESASASPAGVYIPDANEKEEIPNDNTPLSVDLKAGEVNKKDEADNKTVTFTIGGTLASTYTTSTNLGTITVSVEKKETTSEPEVVTYELSTQADGIFYWNQQGTTQRENTDPQWNNVKFVVKGSDGSEKTLEYSDVTVTQITEGEMDLSMKPITEETITREYSFAATVSAEKAGTSEPLSCTFTVTVGNWYMCYPPDGNVLYIYL